MLFLARKNQWKLQFVQQGIVRFQLPLEALNSTDLDEISAVIDDQYGFALVELEQGEGNVKVLCGRHNSMLSVGGCFAIAEDLFTFADTGLFRFNAKLSTVNTPYVLPIVFRFDRENKMLFFRVELVRSIVFAFAAPSTMIDLEKMPYGTGCMIQLPDSNNAHVIVHYDSELQMHRVMDAITGDTLCVLSQSDTWHLFGINAQRNDVCVRFEPAL